VTTRGDYDGARLRRVILDEYAGWRSLRVEGRRLLANADTRETVWAVEWDAKTGRRKVDQAEAAISSLNAVRHAMFDRPRR
jgi:hypothetical protein